MGKLRDALSVKRETKEQIKVGIWCLIGGAIIAMVIGFNWGGWETASATQKMNEEAVLQSQAEICTAQFMEDAKYKDKFAEMQKLDSWSRADFIAQGGWDRMPGQKKADTGVSRACADGIQALTSLK